MTAWVVWMTQRTVRTILFCRRPSEWGRLLRCQAKNCCHQTSRQFMHLYNGSFFQSLPVSTSPEDTGLINKQLLWKVLWDVVVCKLDRTNIISTKGSSQNMKKEMTCMEVGSTNFVLVPRRNLWGSLYRM